MTALRSRFIAVAAPTGAVAGVAMMLTLTSCAAPAPETPAATSAPVASATPVPRTSINQLMVSMIDNSGHVLWDTEKQGFAPKDEADWLEVEDHAIQLAAAGTLIQLGGTGQADMGWIRQVGWKESAEQLSDAALAALAAAKSRSLESVAKANGALVESCESCHKAFKPTAPTEGLVHQRPHSDSHTGH